jgi:splicing factor U2AF 35 kDa subunit
MWNNPLAIVAAAGGDVVAADDDDVQDAFDEFYEEVFDELKNHGKIDEIHVVENLGDHMSGNVYVKYEDEEDAEKALKTLHGRYYAGKMLSCEYSPVTDFREARCRQFDDAICSYGGYCNFLHVREPGRPLRKWLEKERGFFIHATVPSSSGRTGGGSGQYGSGHRGTGHGNGNGGRDRDPRDRERDRDRERRRSPSPRHDRDRDRRDVNRDRDRRRSPSQRDRGREREGDRERHRPAPAPVSQSGGYDPSKF